MGIQDLSYFFSEVNILPNCKEFVYVILKKIYNGHDEHTKFGHNYRKIQVVMIIDNLLDFEIV
jgi:hypothetical protein